MEKQSIRITRTDIIRNFSNVLDEHFPKIEIMDVLKDYPRPAFFTRLDVEKTGHFMTRHVDTDFVFRIYYFPSAPENNEIEMVNIQDELEYLFLVKLERLLSIDNKINIELYDFITDVVEGTVHFYIRLNTSHKIEADEEDGEMLESLELDHKIVNKHVADNNKGVE